MSLDPNDTLSLPLTVATLRTLLACLTQGTAPPQDVAKTISLAIIRTLSSADEDATE